MKDTLFHGIIFFLVFVIIPAALPGLVEIILQEDETINNYNITASTETQKYNIINIIREAGATVTGVSGYGTGYYIQLDATPKQAENINLMLGGC